MFIQCIYFIFENVDRIHSRFLQYAVFKVVVGRFNPKMRGLEYEKVCNDPVGGHLSRLIWQLELVFFALYRV